MNHNQIINMFYDRHPEYNVRANDQILFDTAQKPLSVANLEAAAQRVQLAMAPEFEYALKEFFGKHPEYRCQANVGVLLNLWSGTDVSCEAFEDVANRADKPLTVNAEHQAAAQAQRYREQLIQTITQGRTQFGLFSKAHGAMRYYDSASLESESTETLQQYADEITSRVRFEGQSAQELRQQLRASEQQQNTKSGVVLINPKTGVEYTATELKRLSREEYRRLLTFPSTGQSRPRVADRITAILRGEV